MSSETSYQCDRCGEKIASWESKECIQLGYGYSRGPDKGPRDICKNCLKEFKEWWNEK